MTENRSNISFKDKKEAAEKLIAELPVNLFTLDNVIVLGVSIEGVYFADQLSQKLSCKMDVLLTEPIFSNVNHELAIAIVGETEEIVMHKALIDAFNISKDYIYSEANRKYVEEITYYKNKYRDGLDLENLDQKYVILTDECVETGLTMMAAVKAAISLGAKNIFIAVPILDKVVYENLVTICDNIYCPEKIDDYISKEYYYEILEPLEYDEIEAMIKKNKKKFDEGNMNNE